MKTDKGYRLSIRTILCVLFAGFVLLNPSIVDVRAELISDVVKNTAVGGEALVHKNPKIGDYAVYKIFQKFTVGKSDIIQQMIAKNEIISIKNGIIGIRYSSIPVKDISEYRHVSQFDAADNIIESFINSKGMIIDTYMIVKQMRVHAKFKKASPGEPGYIKYNKINKHLQMKTDAGTFSVQPVWYNTQEVNRTASEIEGTQVDIEHHGTRNSISYINPKIKFLAAVTQFNWSGESRIDTNVVQNMVEGLSWTDFLNDPTDLILNPGGSNLLRYIKGHLKMSKLKELTQNVLSQEMQSEFEQISGSRIDTLIEQGRRK
ncbi:MAG: hypothetical protein JW864_03840 [Spirochaetes bacterium]|nr:hypothetical protein [Spirochaetota bacterium]